MLILDSTSPVNWQHPLNRGLAAWFLAGVQGRTGGAAWIDLVREHQGTLTNMDPPSDWVPTGRPGGFGAIDFDGSDDAVIVPTELTVGGSVAATISCWFKPDTAPALSAMYYESTGSSGWTRWALVHVNTSGVPRAYFRDSETSAAFTISGTSALTNGIWHHCVATVDTVSDRFVLYVNAEQVAINTQAKGPFTSTTPADPIAIGRLSLANEIDGQIDDVRLWYRALSAAEVKAFYDLSRRGYPGLINRIDPIRAMVPVAPTFSAGWAGGSNVILGGGVP